MTWVVVAVAGAAGAVCRYVVDFVVTQRTMGVFPWGTCCVNVAGSLLLGFLVALAAGQAQAPLWLVGATAGFCGAFTTFSTYMFETLALLERGAWRPALWNLTTQVVGVAAAGGGWLLAAPLTG